MHDIEEILNRELHEVADGLHVPALPALPQQPTARRPWPPVLAAAAAVLVVLGVIAVVATTRDDAAPQPTPNPTVTPSPGQTKTSEPPVDTPTGLPKIPYTLDDRLYVDGEQVPGTWWYLQTAGPSWLAMNAEDNTWWWGRGPEPRLIEARIENSGPVLSPDGLYVALIDAEDGVVTGFDTTSSGEGLMSVPVDMRDPGLSVRGVTVDGKVIVQGVGTAMLWLPFDDNRTVDLTDTAPGQDIRENTAAGLVVSDGVDGAQYLAEISDDGVLAPIQDLPPNDTLTVSTAASWMAWTPAGTFGGEVTSVGSLEVETVGGGTRQVFEAPDGWAFKALEWAWETDDYLISPLLPERGDGPERMARCSVLAFECVLIK